MKELVRALLVLLVAFAGLAKAQDAQAEGLEQVVERLDLREIPLREALRLIAEESGVNLVASEAAAATKVSCYLQRVRVRQAIESIAKSYGLWYREDADLNAVHILTTEEFQRDLSLFRDERTQVFTLYYPNALDVALSIRNLFGTRVRFTLDQQSRFDDFAEMNQRFQRFDLLDRRSQGRTVNGQGGVSQLNGFNANTGLGAAGLFGQNQLRTGDPGQYGTANGNNTTGALAPEELGPQETELLQRALSDPDTADREALDRLQNERATIFVSILRKNNQVAVRSADQSALRQIEQIVQALDVPTPQVLLEIRILNLDLGDDFQSAFDFAFADSTTLAGRDPSSIGQQDPGGLVYSFVDGNFQARLQLLQQNRRVNTVASPLLLVANNEVSRLFIGEERPFVRSISSQTTINSNVATTTPTSVIELRSVGTTLLLTPNINADRTVTLRVLQESSDIRVGGASIPVVTGSGNLVQQPVDTVVSRTITGTVVAKDGLTLALGGLIEEGVSDKQEGVPGLMDLPWVGALFRDEAKQRYRRELVVLIRPHVLFTASEGRDRTSELATRLSIHPHRTGERGLDAFTADEAPRPPLGKHPLREMLKYQSALPDGQ